MWIESFELRVPTVIKIDERMKFKRVFLDTKHAHSLRMTHVQ